MNTLRKISQIIEPQNAIEGVGLIHRDEDIDTQVYVLYGFTEEEVKVVEG